MKLYGLFNTLGTVAMLIFNLFLITKRKDMAGGRLRRWAAKHREQGKSGVLYSETLWITVESILISSFQALPMMLMNGPFGKLVGTGANYFGALYTIPFFLIAFLLLLGLDPAENIDMIVPAYPLTLVFVKIACFCAGCCIGIACEFGIPNMYSGIKEFPTQLLESAVALMLFFVMLRIQKTAKPGTVFPIYMILYSGIRFFTEFLRGEANEVWILKRYHFLCLIGVLLGIIEYYVVASVIPALKKRKAQKHLKAEQ